MMTSSLQEIGTVVLVVLACAVFAATLIKIGRARARKRAAELQERRERAKWLTQSGMTPVD
jgi:hypothetical protein